jgi:hypothetical protein
VVLVFSCLPHFMLAWCLFTLAMFNDDFMRCEFNHCVDGPSLMSLLSLAPSAEYIVAPSMMVSLLFGLIAYVLACRLNGNACPSLSDCGPSPSAAMLVYTQTHTHTRTHTHTHT